MSDAAEPVTGCTFIIFRGAMTGRIIECGACAWCIANPRPKPDRPVTP